MAARAPSLHLSHHLLSLCPKPALSREAWHGTATSGMAPSGGHHDAWAGAPSNGRGGSRRSGVGTPRRLIQARNIHVSFVLSRSKAGSMTAAPTTASSVVAWIWGVGPLGDGAPTALSLPTPMPPRLFVPSSTPATPPYIDPCTNPPCNRCMSSGKSGGRSPFRPKSSGGSATTEISVCLGEPFCNYPRY